MLYDELACTTLLLSTLCNLNLYSKVPDIELILKEYGKEVPPIKLLTFCCQAATSVNALEFSLSEFGELVPTSSDKSKIIPPVPTLVCVSLK